MMNTTILTNLTICAMITRRFRSFPYHGDHMHFGQDSVLLIFIVPALYFLLVYLPWVTNPKHPERLDKLRKNLGVDTNDKPPE